MNIDLYNGKYLMKDRLKILATQCQIQVKCLSSYPEAGYAASAPCKALFQWEVLINLFG